MKIQVLGVVLRGCAGQTLPSDLENVLGHRGRVRLAQARCWCGPAAGAVRLRPPAPARADLAAGPRVTTGCDMSVYERHVTAGRFPTGQLYLLVDLVDLVDHLVDLVLPPRPTAARSALLNQLYGASSSPTQLDHQRRARRRRAPRCGL